jgi:hypothetical protein
MQRWLGWKDAVPLRFIAAEPVTAFYQPGHNWSVAVPRCALSLGIKPSEIRLHNTGIAVRGQGDNPWSVHSAVETALTLRLKDQLFPELQLMLQQSGNRQESIFTLHGADSQENIDTELQAALNPLTGEGKIKLDATIKDLAALSKEILSRLRALKLIGPELDLRTGAFALATTITSKRYDWRSWRQQSQASLTNVSGSVSGYRFEGLSLNAHWLGITHWKTQKPLHLKLANLVPGFTVSNIDLLISLPDATPVARPRLRLDALSAEMFDGRVEIAQPLWWDFSATRNHITLWAHDWQLSELVALQPNADIQATGTLEGKLPLTVDSGRGILSGGYLRALPPGGSIRYRPNAQALALSDNNDELTLALSLLRDFQYQVLGADVQLDKAGNLQLGLSLSGSNPTQYDGQAVNFNINVEQNLDRLLQSLRLSDNVTSQIEKKIH